MARTMRPIRFEVPSRTGKTADEFLAQVESFCLSAGKELLALTTEVAELQEKLANVKDKVDGIKTK